MSLSTLRVGNRYHECYKGRNQLPVSSHSSKWRAITKLTTTVWDYYWSPSIAMPAMSYTMVIQVALLCCMVLAHCSHALAVHHHYSDGQLVKRYVDANFTTEQVLQHLRDNRHITDRQSHNSTRCSYHIIMATYMYTIDWEIFVFKNICQQPFPM